MVIDRSQKILYCWHAARGTRDSDCVAENAALEAALRWLKRASDWYNAAIVCDCKSGVEVADCPHQTNPGMVFLQLSVARTTFSKKLNIVWVPGNCNLLSNDWKTQRPNRNPHYPNLQTYAWTQILGKP